MPFKLLVDPGFRRGDEQAVWLQAGSIRLEIAMKFKAVIHEADDGGYWAEVPEIPGCATQGETLDELMANLREAIEGCLSS
jgi:hypothetical protein